MPKPQPILINPDEIASQHAQTGQLWVKTCTTFDHAHVLAQSWCLVWDREGQPCTARWTTYDNTLSKSKPRPLDLDTLAKPTDDPAKVIAALEKAGWTIHQPPAPPAPEPAPKRRGDGPRRLREGEDRTPGHPPGGPVRITTRSHAMKPAAYVRCSLDDADPARQHAEIDEWATQEHTDINYYQDVGGRRTEADDIRKRPEWARLWDDLESGKYTHLVVSDTSRLGFRDEWELLVLAGRLRKMGIKLIEARTRRCLNDADIASIISTSVDGHHHASHVRDLAINTLRQKLGYAMSVGAWQGGMIPYGMMVVCKRPDGSTRWSLEIENDGTRRQEYEGGQVLTHPADYFPSDRRRGKKEDSGVREHLFLVPTKRHPERLEAVKLVFRWFLSERISPTLLAKRLTKLGHHPPGPPESRWYYLRIFRILDSPAYTGRMLYGRRTKAQYHRVNGPGQIIATESQGKVKQRIKPAEEWQWSEPIVGFGPPIISLEDWQRCQAKLKAEKGTRRPKSEAFLFSSLARCGHCGGNLVGVRKVKQGRETLVYRCSAYIKKISAGGPNTGCGAMDIDQRRLAAAVDAWIGDQATTLTRATEGDEKLLLGRLYEDRAGTYQALRDAKKQVEGWVGTALEQVASPTLLTDGRKRYEFPVSGGDTHVITLPDCESFADLMVIYHWLESATRHSAKAELDRLEQEHDRITQAFMMAPTPGIAQKIKTEAARIEAELARAKAGRTHLGARVRELFATIYAQSRALNVARDELAGSEPARRAQLYRDLIECVTVHHVRGMHGKREVWKLDRIEVLGRSSGGA